MGSSSRSRAMATVTRIYAILPNNCGRELTWCPGVGKVGIVGILPEEVQVEISRAQMTAAGITPQQLSDLLSRQNVVSERYRSYRRVA